jgi:cytochrome P450
MSQLVSEVRTVFKKESDITFRSMIGLTYLAAVIEESLRMYPPFVTSLARVVPHGGTVINGQFVAEGVRTV